MTFNHEKKKKKNEGKKYTYEIGVSVIREA